MALAAVNAEEAGAGGDKKSESFNIDDPQNISSFLTAMNIAVTSAQPEPARNSGSENVPNAQSSKPADVRSGPGDREMPEARGGPESSEAIAVCKIPQANSRSHHLTASPTTVSPVPGTTAPHPTPAIGGVTSWPVVPALESIEEDGSDILRTIANASNLKLKDSYHAPRNYKGGRISANSTKHTGLPMSASHVEHANIPALRSAQGRNILAADTKQVDIPAHLSSPLSFSNSFTLLDTDKVLEIVSKKTEQEDAMTQYEEEVLRKFIADHSTVGEQKEVGPTTGATDQSLENERKFKPKVESSPTKEDDEIDSTTPQLADKVTQSTVDSPENVKTPVANPTTTITAPAEDHDGEEDREYLTHFKSWGSPTPRHRPAARVRKIILSNLPSDADLTLVQSLVFGGALESFHLSPSKTTAYVTFVDAHACDAFYAAYPNGLVFKNPTTCRNHVVYVDKGKDVDVVSGILQAYLDCQASRVVRATGADQDWSMRALYAVAESKNRKVETIVDTYRNEVRTIVFRFASIANAVNFRNEILRDEDWEGCNIQFMDDPVDKATGVHLEE